MLDKFQKNISLADYTSFKVGGPAKYFFKAQNLEDLIKAVKTAKKENLEYFILGGGTNVLISDNGFEGLVIKVDFERIDLCKSEISQGDSLKVGAGNTLVSVVNLFSQKSFTNMEWAAGIPGSFGGAVRGNAGAFDSDMAMVIESVYAYDILKQEIIKLNNSNCQFQYRNSVFKTNKNYIILEAILRLKSGNSEEIKNKVAKNIEYRQKNHPLDFPSAGSTFKNIETDKFSRDILDKINPPEPMTNSGIIPAGFIIDRLGLKGYHIGGAQISDKHANFILNTGKARAQDILDLINLVKEKALDNFGIKMEEEILLLF